MVLMLHVSLWVGGDISAGTARNDWPTCWNWIGMQLLLIHKFCPDVLWKSPSFKKDYTSFHPETIAKIFPTTLHMESRHCRTSSWWNEFEVKVVTSVLFGHNRACIIGWCLLPWKKNEEWILRMLMANSFTAAAMVVVFVMQQHTFRAMMLILMWWWWLSVLLES